MTKKPTNPKRSQWQRHISCQQRSGLSRVEYCKQNSLDYAQFGYYFSLLKSKVANDTSDDFVPLHIISHPETVSTTQFTLTNPDGTTLCWSTDWSPLQVVEFISSWGQRA